MDYNIDYEIPVTEKDVNLEIGNLTTMSSKIRYLSEKGYTRSQIAKQLNIRYQWVRNVLITPIKK
jgi:DNA-binding NarL/FixJ family response regulator